MNAQTLETIKAKVIIRSINKFDEVEWTETFESITMTAAKAKANRFMRNNHFELSALKEVVKTSMFAIYELH